MDGCDFYDYFVKPLTDLDNTVLANLADNVLGKDWFLTQKGRDDVADKIANASYDDYVNTGACDHWGPAAWMNYYLLVNDK